MTWSDGYMADTEYTSHYFAELAPPMLDLAALAAGVMPPDRQNGRFRYCELGCGNGMSTNILAASHPDAEFVGIDFMPVHVANARRAAKRGDLNNIRFLELSFADACREDLGSFDYIVAHGVFSWIPPQTRTDMVEFFRRFLAPGGLVYLSYNTYPGWLGISPVQKIVQEFSKTLKGPSTKRTRAGFDFAAQLLEKKAGAFSVYPAAAMQIEKAKTQPINYLAQEYLNESWYPLYVTDVMRELLPAKLEYVASATLAENDMRFLVNDDMAVVIRDQPTEELRQLVKDIAINARFRRDIYSKGGRRLSGLDQRQMLGEQLIALNRVPETENYSVTYLGRNLGFDTPAARAMVAVLAQGPRTLAELAVLATDAQDPLRVALEVAMILCIGGWAQPADPMRSANQAMNAALIAAALEDSACNAVATGLGGGLLVSPTEMAMLENPLAFNSIESGIAHLSDVAKRKGRKFKPNGELPKTEAELTTYLHDEVIKAHKRAGTFRQFGVLPDSGNESAA